MHINPPSLCEALEKVGLRSGDVVYIHCQLFGIDPIPGVDSGTKMCGAILRAFQNVLGPSGTIVTPTFTTRNVGRYGSPFVLETTPADTGLFPEYVRTQKGSLRSLHPINSVAGIGPAAEYICKNLSRTNYGAETPFSRMLELDAKAVNIGFSNRFSNSWHHHAEAELNLPYLYNKLLGIDVWADGKQIKSPFFATVRYLDFAIGNDLSRFDRFLIDEKHIDLCKLGRGYISQISAKKYYQLALAKLIEDPWYMLREPPKFVLGERPYDRRGDIEDVGLGRGFPEPGSKG